MFARQLVQGKNEHFELIFNAAITTQVINQRFLRRAANIIALASWKCQGNGRVSAAITGQ